MNRISIIALVFGALLFGCGVGMVAHDMVESQAVAQTVWTGQKWDYMCDNYAGNAYPQLKEMGKSGWELVDMEHDYYCFKRPLP